MQGWRAEVVAIALGLVFWAGLAIWLVPGPPAALAACRAAPSAGCLADLALDRLRREPAGYFHAEIYMLGQLGRVEDALPLAERSAECAIRADRVVASDRDSAVAYSLAPHRMVAALRAGGDFDGVVAGEDGEVLGLTASALMDGSSGAWDPPGPRPISAPDRAILQNLAARLVALDHAGTGGADLAQAAQIYAALGAHDQLMDILARVGPDKAEFYARDAAVFRLAGSDPVIAALRRQEMSPLMSEFVTAATVALRDEAAPERADSYLREAFDHAHDWVREVETGVDAETDAAVETLKIEAFEQQGEIVGKAVALGRLDLAAALATALDRLVAPMDAPQWIDVHLVAAEALQTAKVAPDQVRARLAVAEAMIPGKGLAEMAATMDRLGHSSPRGRIDRILADLENPDAGARAQVEPSDQTALAAEALGTVSADPSPAQCGPAMAIAEAVMADWPWDQTFAGLFNARRIAEWCGASEVAEAALARLTRKALLSGNGQELLSAAVEWQRLGRLR